MTSRNQGAAAAAAANPFPGLRPFEMEEYRLFFGREGQADALVERLERSRFLAVVGTSGSGKSSLVRAGLLPALRGGMMAGAGAGWRVAVTRPGHDPVGNLARALAEDGVLPEAGAGLRPAEREAVVEATLRGGSLGLVEVAARSRLSQKLLVVVDQFEELFRFRAARAAAGATDDDASAFVKLLLEAARQRDLPLYVVLTMRSDFLGDCAQFQGLPEAINDGQYLIPRMTRDERRFAITGPARVARGLMSEPLVNRLLNDVGDNPDQLPILQHALMRTWDYWSGRRRDGEPVGLEHYEAVGTMADALSLHADEAWNELEDERGRRVAEYLFKALTERGADNREIRRPTRLREICEIAGATPEEVASVVEVFRREGRSFLMPPAGVALTPETVIDISHESLIRNWARLREWVRDEGEAARIYRRLADAAVANRAGEGGLLDDVTLAWVDRWRERYHPSRAWGVRYHPEYDAAMAYLEESRAASEQRAADARAREERELEQARAFAEEQRRAALRLRRLLVVLVAVSVLALGAAGGAAYAYTLARNSQKLAEDKERQTRELAGDLEASRREVAAAREEVEQQSRAVKDAEAVAAVKTEKALAEQERAETALAEADRAKAVAGEMRAKAIEEGRRTSEALVTLHTQTEYDHRNRDALASFQRGNMDEAESKLEALAADYKDDPLRQAWAEAYLGAARRQLGKLPESVAALKSAREIQQRAIAQGRLSKEDPEYLDTLTWLGHAHSDRGEYELARPLYEEALAIRRGSGRHADIAVGLENLARNYDNLYRAEETAKLYGEALELRRRNPHSPDLVTALKEVAEFYVEQDGHREAIKLYEEALVHQAAYLAPDDPKLADTFAGLAEIYEDTPYKMRAEIYNSLARGIRRFGHDRHAGTTGFAALAAAYVRAGRYRRAGLLLTAEQKALAESQGAEARGAVNNLVSLGDFYAYAARRTPEADRQEFRARASEIYGRALEITARKSYKAAQVDALDGLARLSFDQQNFAEAERHYKRALEMRERGEAGQVRDAEKMLDNLEGLALAASGLGRHAEAEAHLQRALKFYDGLSVIARNEMVVRRVHPELLRHALSTRLAEVNRAQGRLKEADEQYRHLLGPLTSVKREFLDVPVNAERYLYVVESAGRFYSERGDAAAAESFYLLVWPPAIRPVVRTLVVWPDAYSDSLPETAPASSLDAVIRILESYAALLKKQGRDRDADLIDFGVNRVRERLLNEMPTMPLP
ncbi:MAG: tetratricopeptide repeat protein [Acidobacteria bacterium]|nr:tetratricopeptide repeat protein [Acidobacteriota bacterium]